MWYLPNVAEPNFKFNPLAWAELENPGLCHKHDGPEQCLPCPTIAPLFLTTRQVGVYPEPLFCFPSGALLRH